MVLAKTTTVKDKGPSKQAISACFFLMFAYALLLLMISYTNPSLKKITLNAKDNSLWLVVPQLCGLAVGGIALKPIFKRFNTRTILITGATIAMVITGFFAGLDKISHNNKKTALGIYLPLNFLFGLAISVIPPVVSTYLGTHFSGKKANQYVSGVNGLYGLGGGIIPIVAAGPILNLKGADFDKVRYFFFIALGFCVLIIFASLMLNYRFTQDVKSDLSEDKKGSPKQKKLLIELGILIGVCFFLYLIFESGANYGLSSKYVDHYDSKSTTEKVTLIRGLGLFFIVQGLWRAGSPFLFEKVRFRMFVLFSAFFVAGGFGLLAGNLLSTDVCYVYLVASLLGIGVGNIWPVIFSFAQGSFEPRRSTMAIIANMVTFIELPFSAVIVSFSLSGEAGRMPFAIVCAILPFLIFGVMTLIIAFLKHKKLTHSDEK